MRTSPTERGFTLVEVLVVMVVCGVGFALIAVNLAPRADAALQEEARRIGALLDHAREEAIVSGRPLAWQADAVGYGFSANVRGIGWALLEGDPVLKPRAWPPGVALVGLRIGGVPLAAGGPLVFSPSGINLPFDIVLAQAGKHVAISRDGTGGIAVQK